MAPRKQLMALETELRDSGIVYTYPPGHHDRLSISRHADVDRLPSAFELLGQRRYVCGVRAEQTVSNIWLSSLYIRIFQLCWS